MGTARKIKITCKPASKKQQQIVSKSWLAALEHKGTGKIDDMNAVLKWYYAKIFIRHKYLSIYDTRGAR